MPSVYVFNPENDLALANGGINYTAPKNAQCFRDVGAALPLWICDEGDYIAVPSIDANWYAWVKREFNLKGDLFVPPLEFSSEYHGKPWGWSLDALTQLQLVGVTKEALPSTDEIRKIRDLSHRRLAIEVNRRLKEALSFETPNIPIEAYSIGQLEEFLDKYQSCFIKSPWSGSGRGVFETSALPKTEVKRRAMGVISRQGSVVCEQCLEKVKDFAMLFHSNGKSTSFVGYSLFFIDSRNIYTGNILTTDEYIEQELSTLVPRDQLREIIANLEIIFSDIVSASYKGYFGVDMMIYHDGGKLKIAPCIEVNLRMTMGVVAWIWQQRYLGDKSRAVMRVTHGEIPALQTSPKIELGKLNQGIVYLIPPNDQFNITVDATEF